MDDFDRWEWREADGFYTDLMRPRGRRRPTSNRAAAESATESPVEAVAPLPIEDTGDLIDAGRVFDEIVHGGFETGALLPTETEEGGGQWETIALPRSSVRPEDLPAGALVFERALGEGRLGSRRVLGSGIGIQHLYGPDGRIRDNILIVIRRVPAVAPGPTIVIASEAEWDLSSILASAANMVRFPARDPTAPGGRAFLQTIMSEKAPTTVSDWVTRENAIVAQIVAGNMPAALLKWVKVDLTYTGKQGTVTGSVEVLPDYVSVGHDGDYVQVPLDPVSAQAVADKFDAILPTARICHAIYLQASAKNRINAIERDYWQANGALRKTAKPGRDQTASAAYLEHGEAIQAKMKAASIPLGELVAGHKKDVCIARSLHARSDRIAFQGFYDDKGFPHEPCYENKEARPKPDCAKDTPTLAHSRRFSDYSQGVRLVHPSMIVNGERRRVADVLADPDLSFLISSEGPIVPPRIPNTAKASGPKASTGEEEEADPEGDPVPGVSAVTIAAATGLGTERTTAPIATVSPQRQMNELLDRELILFAQARHVAEWVNSKFSATVDQLLADRALVAKLDVSKDKSLWQKLRPFPQNKIPDRRGQLFTEDAVLQALLRPPVDAGGVGPILDLLHDYGVVLLPRSAQTSGGIREILASVTRVDARLTRSRFDTDSVAVEKRAVTFKQDVGNKNMLHHAVESEVIPADIWVDPKAPALAVAKPVLALLRRVRERNKAWRVGTYVGHFWNDFSADIFIAANINPDGFWARDRVRDFFKALNEACEQDITPGKFAWKAIYNDAGLAQDMDALFGAGRVLHGVDGHGPGPRMHVHLDLRPLAVPFDSTTGFWLDGRRISLSPPGLPASSATGAASMTAAPARSTSGLARSTREQVDEAVPQKGRGAFRHEPLGGDAGNNVEARWNVDAATAAGSSVDIVVYLHGYGKPEKDFLAQKADEAGLDLVDGTGAVKVRASRPSLALVPRGKFGSKRSWFFTTLPDPKAFDALVTAALAWLADSVLKLPSGSSLTRGRLTLIAHSGGGAGVSALLDKGLNPDEVICFDSMYGGEEPIRKWAEVRIASAQASQSGLRVFYLACSGPLKDHPAGRWVPQTKGEPLYEDPGSWSYWTSDNRWHLGSTEVSARRLQFRLDHAIAKATAGGALAARFRVERTSVRHGQIPARYGPLLLENIAASVPNAEAPPPATTGPACVANSNWLTDPPQKPGGDDPPPSKPQ